MPTLKKILIANRGEIAVRILRTARAMGIATVAVYSEADANSMHVLLADEAIAIGKSEPSESYLKSDLILKAAQESGADAIHPGYGFLSERAEFSEACAKAGITFLGPTAAAMRKLGAKIDAKQLAMQCDVPITPGYFEPGATSAKIREEAEKIGYPVMLKASAGGGGRGMRVVRDPLLIEEEFDLAAEESLNAFGDSAMMVEKLVERPRHIEVQLAADLHGSVAVLFERECSLQRRHQKVVEEAPSPYLLLHPEMWEAMRTAAIKLAKAAEYTGVGTVEFMVDEQTDKFYFLEVNARLQVEHPVTEEITGLDLVKLQIEIAEGKPLNLTDGIQSGNRESICGHAIEVRVIAEDPSQNFLPSIGKIKAWVDPRHPGIRIDTGFGPDSEVSRFYDSLIAKVIATGPTRIATIQRLEQALLDFHILGVKTNIAYVLDVLRHPDFISGTFDTGFLAREFGDWNPTEFPPELGSIAKQASFSRESGTQKDSAGTASVAAWASSDGFRNARPNP